MSKPVCITRTPTPATDAKASRCSPSIQDGAALNVRLSRIVRALDELNRCVAERGKHHANKEEAWGLTIGELDWRSELHRILFQED